MTKKQLIVRVGSLMKTLSPKRLELLQTLHALGAVSIRKLANKSSAA